MESGDFEYYDFEYPADISPYYLKVEAIISPKAFLDGFEPGTVNFIMRFGKIINGEFIVMQRLKTSDSSVQWQHKLLFLTCPRQYLHNMDGRSWDQFMPGMTLRNGKVIARHDLTR